VCTECRAQANEYADATGSLVCKTCGANQRSVQGVACQDRVADDNLPKIVQAPNVTRQHRDGAGTWDDGGAVVVVTWTPFRRDTSVTGIELQISTDYDFAAAGATQSYLEIAPNATSFTVSLATPVCDQVVYAQVRAVQNIVGSGVHNDDDDDDNDDDNNNQKNNQKNNKVTKDTVGKWSPRSKPWLSTGNEDCRLSTQFLDCSESNAPHDWICADCPHGADCEGSVRWTQVLAKPGFWRDNRVLEKGSSGVPREQQFVPCTNKKACEEVRQEQRVVGASLAERHRLRACALGYLDVCDPKTNGTCRLCRTCTSNYTMMSDGITCAPCEESEVEQDGMLSDEQVAMIATVLIFMLVLLIFSLLVFLRIRSATSGRSDGIKAIHSTIKRIILSHMQVVMLSLSLNVPWPNMLVGLMIAFSSLSSVSQHVAQVGCLVDTEIPVHKQSRFLYASATAVALFPIIFGILLWIWWLVLVPIKCCACMACFRRDRLTLSDPIPNMLRKLVCSGRREGREEEPGRSRALTLGSSDAEATTLTPGAHKDEDEDDHALPGSSSQQSSPQRPTRRHIKQQDITAAIENAAPDTPEERENLAKRQRDLLVLRILQDDQVKTRDVWAYSTVLFLCKCDRVYTISGCARMPLASSAHMYLAVTHHPSYHRRTLITPNTTAAL
jgi:hypothetical protein